MFLSSIWVKFATSTLLNEERKCTNCHLISTGLIHVPRVGNDSTTIVQTMQEGWQQIGHQSDEFPSRGCFFLPLKDAKFSRALFFKFFGCEPFDANSARVMFLYLLCCRVPGSKVFILPIASLQVTCLTKCTPRM